MNGVICSVYRSLKIDETYLYFDKSRVLEAVPEALLALFGEPRLLMTMLLKE